MEVQQFSGKNPLHLKEFFFKVLSGSATGILIGVVPSALMKYIILYSGMANNHIGAEFSAILTLFTSMIPFLIGMAVAMNFKMNTLQTGVVALATMVASNSILWGMAQPGTVHPLSCKVIGTPSRIYMAAGAGDVINAMLVAGIAVFAIWLVDRYLNGFGSMAIILSPIIVGGGVGLFGKLIAPTVGELTNLIGKGVESFTNLAPLPMAILIAMAFSVIIITPVSSVGIALAINLSGLGAGAAAMGVVATTIVLIINSWQVNKKGTTLAIFLGAMKGMMPSIFKKPVMLLSFMFAGALSALTVPLFNIQGTPTTAGFGFIGMVSPLQSMIKDAAIPSSVMNHYINPLVGLIAWVIVPVIASFIAQLIFSKWLKLYSPEDLKQEL
ncbi:PTS sugar transporter subunit IIC [Fructobacillus sp. M2-14]|uniref:PTS sugar transporter subunit IIC n=1 Tax=Fructobacillus broussonetiae TaxID=2713173 RepID=A0ABS5R106_9LACO|nr:PTS sugar transporter subunit IIC [Fructobacillus broussonetiae]MBS9338902.1 PTS sugar transporter subunit IIC [Fructobacillus broussonetiae]